jgi:hypothetical protein
MAKCKGCGADIEFVEIKKTGKKIPVDVTIKAIVTEHGFIVRGREAHFSSCPKAAEFRKSKGGSNEPKRGDNCPGTDTGQQATREQGQL